jgi:acyl-CoA synthetase (AMP-forming)/AMP-acid ligase II
MVSMPSFNLAQSVWSAAAERPDQDAIVWRGSAAHDGSLLHISFAELDRLSDAIAGAVLQAGLRPAARVLLWMPSGAPFLGTVFGLLKAGCVPVIADQGAAPAVVAECIADCEVETAICSDSFQRVRGELGALLGRRLHELEWSGPNWADPLGCMALARSVTKPHMAQTAADDPAVILLTTGSTGTPKPVVVSHATYDAARCALRQVRGVRPGERDLSTFAPFSIFNPGNRVTSVIPDLPVGRPADCDPEQLAALIREQEITTGFGSPALCMRLVDHCRGRGIVLRSLQRFVVAGGTVNPELLDAFQSVMVPPADVYMGYGATEVFSITSISGREVLAAVRGRADHPDGRCVGRPVPGISVRVIEIRDEPIPRWGECRVLAANEIGEIIVKGPMVSSGYANRPTADAVSKIRDGAGFWHRMGDVGYFDEEGRLWYCGRKSQRVRIASKTLFTEPCEAVFLTHPQVARCALVGVRRETGMLPVIVVEPRAGSLLEDIPARRQVQSELLGRAARFEQTASIGNVLFHPRLPVDSRHNSKILREQLVEWATRELQHQALQEVST